MATNKINFRNILCVVIHGVFCCVLYFSGLIKASNRGLAGNKGKFSVKFEIDYLRFVIYPGSQHRRRACMGILKQTRNYKKKLDDLNDKLLRQYHEKAGANRPSVKTSD